MTNKLSTTSVNIEALDADFAEYLLQLARLACVALEFTGPLTLSYSVDSGCTIKVTLEKVKAQ